jgi:large subunit ribosomal protein L21
MYAIIEAGGRQWKVEPGTQFDINRLSAEVGALHTVERVLFASQDSGVNIGRPYLPGAKVICEVLAHRQGPKAISYHFRRRENWRKTVGHRQPLTRLVVKEINLQNEK